MLDVDRFGNRWQQNGQHTFIAMFTGNNPANPQNNNRMDGYAHDAAGNVMNDGTNQYTYDAENRITKVNLGSPTGALIATYVYDADGHRVAETTTTGNYSDPAGTFQFLYDQSGRMIQRFDGTFFEGNVYAGGRSLARLAAWTSFIHSDWLGTKRMSNRFATPTTLNNCSSLPFGDGLNCTGSDDSPIHFTGKERDAATGLDNFGARYNASSMGRFMSPDPLYQELHRLVDPQQLNLYAYGRNNPLAYTDPTGLDITCNGARCDDYLKALQKDVSFKIAYDKNGKVGTVGDIDQKSLSTSDKAFLSAISDSQHHVTITATGGDKDSSVFFGASHGAAHTINFDQAALLDSPKNAGGMTSAALVGHETLEAYDESQGYSMNEGHNYAACMGFPGFDIGTAVSAQTQNDMVIGITVNFPVQGTSTTEQIQTRYVTKIPKVDFLKGKGLPAPAYPISAEKKP